MIFKNFYKNCFIFQNIKMNYYDFKFRCPLSKKTCFSRTGSKISMWCWHRAIIRVQPWICKAFFTDLTPTWDPEKDNHVMRYLLNMWSPKLAGCQHGNIAFSTRDRIFESLGGWIFGSNNGAQTTWVCELCPASHTPFFPQPQDWPLCSREGSYSWLYFSGGNTTHLWECKGVP